MLPRYMISLQTERYNILCDKSRSCEAHKAHEKHATDHSGRLGRDLREARAGGGRIAVDPTFACPTTTGGFVALGTWPCEPWLLGRGFTYAGGGDTTIRCTGAAL